MAPDVPAVLVSFMADWVLGDVHGCAEELAELLPQLQLGLQDRLICVGDLYHRGPDPAGVHALLSQVPNLAVVLGNHERVLLRRLGAAGERADGSDARALPAELRAPGPELLRGDGGVPLAPVAPDRVLPLLRFLEGRSYYLEGNHRGRKWWVVHAGILPGLHPRDTHPESLVRLRRLQRLPGAPFWYEVYGGPDLVLFGHTPARYPRAHHARGRLVALGVDTGCVYGGRLTAYRIQDGETVSVAARRAYSR